MVSSHPPLGFPFYLCSLVSEHKAYIKNSKSIKSSVGFQHSEFTEDLIFFFFAVKWCILCFCCRITFIWQSNFRHFLNMFIWNKNLHERLLHNSKWVLRDSSPQIDSKSPPGTRTHLAFSIITWWWLWSLDVFEVPF